MNSLLKHNFENNNNNNKKLKKSINTLVFILKIIINCKLFMSFGGSICNTNIEKYIFPEKIK
jgi:hypothetical protein